MLTAASVRAEVCDDCTDDDRDALVDCHDPDCRSAPACAGNYLEAGAAAPCAPVLSLRLLWSSPLGYDTTVPAVGDVDADGMPEVVFTTPLPGVNRLVVLDGATGSVEHASAPLPGPWWWGQLAIGDVDLDGTAEIFAGGGIL